MTRLLALLMMTGLLAAAAIAQPPTALITYYETPLTMTGDGKREPVPDGTEIRIRWDWDDNGPDAKDPLPVVGEEYGEASINRFEVNSKEIAMEPGMFATMMPLSIYGDMPKPATYYLEVCLDDYILQSNVFELQPGFLTVKIESWTKVDRKCEEIK